MQALPLTLAFHFPDEVLGSDGPSQSRCVPGSCGLWLRGHSLALRPTWGFLVPPVGEAEWTAGGRWGPEQSSFVLG